jgi:hypothetical protein
LVLGASLVIGAWSLVLGHSRLLSADRRLYRRSPFTE